ncbi:MAG: hypothetical protein JXA21_19150 [Anaerolineae bacterium]|nr:hypothetical protein [Anaerolineae bacterium]
MISPFVKLTTVTGSLITLGFGVWHFFVPRVWHWYSSFDQNVPELVAAVRVINFFSSLYLVCFGVVSILFVYREPVDRFYLQVQLLLMALLWGLRVVMQLISPQGMRSPFLRYGMLAAFALAFGLFFVAYLGSVGK